MVLYPKVVVKLLFIRFFFYSIGDGFGSQGFMSFKFGSNKWLFVAWDIVPPMTNKFIVEVYVTISSPSSSLWTVQ